MCYNRYGNHMLETSYLSVLIFQKMIADSSYRNSLFQWQPTVTTKTLNLCKYFNINVCSKFKSNVANIVKWKGNTIQKLILEEETVPCDSEQLG